MLVNEMLHLQMPCLQIAAIFVSLQKNMHFKRLPFHSILYVLEDLTSLLITDFVKVMMLKLEQLLKEELLVLFYTVLQITRPVTGTG